MGTNVSSVTDCNNGITFGSDNFNGVTIGVILFNGFTMLDVIGSMDFWYALSFDANIRVITIASQTGPVSNNLTKNRITRQDKYFSLCLEATHTFHNCPKLDILYIPGGPDVDCIQNHVEAINFIKERYNEVSYVCSVCTGAMMLAETGLLNGLNATTNKMGFLDIQKRAPQVNWIAKARWVVSSNKILTSSGVSAGMDMTYFLIKSLYGEAVADKCAHILEYAPHKDADWDPFSQIVFDKLKEEQEQQGQGQQQQQ
ncbi:hypothetical protein H4219_005276 [Mycoemilia scoparia]|uniref:DJ-1/PfpI domain-containing protein n=1 Tax=Mycoemilia scoparia TaxID=417184 RepID=A0A9W7ZWT0_9FUNG|nr:hypothetical protein H4219_005276 [Mycoemilia scoparia]